MAHAISYLDIQTLRTWFRRWYGFLSIEELATNHEISQKIQEIETLLQELSYGK
jgi:hypothetical protein